MPRDKRKAFQSLLFAANKEMAVSDAVSEELDELQEDMRKEFAEEIAELEELIRTQSIKITDESGRIGYATNSVYYALLELKKKYTEGEST